MLNPITFCNIINYFKKHSILNLIINSMQWFPHSKMAVQLLKSRIVVIMLAFDHVVIRIKIMALKGTLTSIISGNKSLILH